MCSRHHQTPYRIAFFVLGAVVSLCAFCLRRSSRLRNGVLGGQLSRSAKVIAGSIAVLLLGAVSYLRLRTPSRPGIVLITIDTLRVDRVGAYGSKTVLTPAIDSVAAHGIRFDAAYSTVPLTLPSHLSILSGRLPVEHSVRSNDGYRVPDNVPLVAEALEHSGYRTAAFVGSSVLRSSTGISRGFQLYDDDMGQAAERPGGEVVRRTIDWLQSIKEEPFFLWMHLNDPHLPYNPPEPYKSEYKDHLYDGEVAYADHCVGSLMAELDRLGLSKRVTVIVAADHGEGLGDHGERSHGVLLYDSTIHVPLIIRPAARMPSPVTVNQPVTAAQIAPTILLLAGLPNNSAIPGLLDREAKPSMAVAETLYLAQQLGWSAMYAARSGPFKLIDAPKPELYDVETDPGELHDLAADKPEIMQKLREELRANLTSLAKKAAQPAPFSAEAKAVHQLASLGYVADSGRTAAGFVPVAGIDPRPRIAEWEQVEHGIQLSLMGDQKAATSAFESVLRQDPENVLALKFLGAAALERGDLARSIDYNQRVVSTGLHLADALSNLSLAYYRSGRLDAALTSARAAVRADPGHHAARANLVLILQTIGSDRARAGDVGGALAAFQEAATIDPSDLDVAERLAAVLDQAGHTDEARHLFEFVVRSAPDRPEPQLSLAMIDLEAGHPQDAVSRLERFGRDWSGAYRAQYLLGEAYRRLGDRQRARAAYLECLAEAPHSDPIVPAARQGLAELESN
jgi:choline-sulfatase